MNKFYFVLYYILPYVLHASTDTHGLKATAVAVQKIDSDTYLDEWLQLSAWLCNAIQLRKTSCARKLKLPSGAQ